MGRGVVVTFTLVSDDAWCIPDKFLHVLQRASSSSNTDVIATSGQ